MLTLWYTPVLLRIFLINTIFPWLLKGKVIQKNFIQRFFLQYLFCSIFVVVVAACLGQLTLTLTVIIIGIVGFFNGFGCYSQWKAAQFNLSAMSIFAFLDDAIAIALGYLILKEGKFINTGVGTGLILCAGVVILFALNNFWKKKKEVKGKECIPLKFFFHVLSFTAIWGIAAFLMRYFALENVGVGTFIFGWYAGSFITAFVLFLFKKEENLITEIKRTMTGSNLSLMSIMSALIMANVWLTYWALRVAPLTVVKPIFFVSAMVLPAVIGIWVFKEGEKYDKKERLLFILAVVGGMIVAGNFTP